MSLTKWGVMGCLSVALLGCLKPSVPEAKDVTKGLEEFWLPCKIVRPVDVKKINGADRGDFYLMAIEYRVEFTSDFAKEDFWGAELPKVDFSNLDYHEGVKKNKERYELTQKIAERKSAFWEKSCPDAAIWEYMNGAWQASPDGARLVGQDLKKGDGVTIQAEFKMIQSEKGWISVVR
ncbi:MULTISPECIES: hypothetical protein [unclassified Simplicispira]|uniref:hypothetical protein n=1 Tax=unclassified Simplicispira TaxID=2630407 RepID=UPI000D5DBF47|nr:MULTISPECIES: hypothetical protein [unclassified Simplicispira]PVY58375.1 hypothetical protein C8D04_3694 [Simplicispira sp. 125]REG15741.1 hypothetical protein C8D01_0277 [Simplicispira sp. 110]